MTSLPEVLTVTTTVGLSSAELPQSPPPPPLLTPQQQNSILSLFSGSHATTSTAASPQEKREGNEIAKIEEHDGRPTLLELSAAWNFWTETNTTGCLRLEETIEKWEMFVEILPLYTAKMTTETSVHLFRAVVQPLRSDSIVSTGWSIALLGKDDPSSNKLWDDLTRSCVTEQLPATAEISGISYYKKSHSSPAYIIPWCNQWTCDSSVKVFLQWLYSHTANWVTSLVTCRNSSGKVDSFCNTLTPPLTVGEPAIIPTTTVPSTLTPQNQDEGSDLIMMTTSSTSSAMTATAPVTTTASSSIVSNLNVKARSWVPPSTIIPSSLTGTNPNAKPWFPAPAKSKQLPPSPDHSTASATATTPTSSPSATPPVTSSPSSTTTVGTLPSEGFRRGPLIPDTSLSYSGGKPEVALAQPWAFWMATFIGGRTSPATRNLQRMQTIHTFEEYADLLPKNSARTPWSSTLYLFKESVKPCYYEPANCAGGHLKMKGLSNDKTHTIFRYLTLMMIFEGLPHMEDICGTSLVKKQHDTAVTLWFRNSNDSQLVASLQEWVSSISQWMRTKPRMTPHKYLLQTLAKQQNQAQARSSLLRADPSSSLVPPETLRIPRTKSGAVVCSSAQTFSLLGSVISTENPRRPRTDAPIPSSSSSSNSSGSGSGSTLKEKDIPPVTESPKKEVSPITPVTESPNSSSTATLTTSSSTSPDDTEDEFLLTRAGDLVVEFDTVATVSPTFSSSQNNQSICRNPAPPPMLTQLSDLPTPLYDLFSQPRATSGAGGPLLSLPTSWVFDFLNNT